MVSVGSDKRAIIWKIPEETQLIFKPRDYPLDGLVALSPYNFVSGGQNGEIALWSTRKDKPVCKLGDMHEKGWIGSLAGIYQSDVVVSGAADSKLRFYKANLQMNKIIRDEDLFLPCEGIVNCVDLSEDCKMLAVVESSEHRLGRWITSKKRSKIRLFYLDESKEIEERLEEEPHSITKNYKQNGVDKDEEEDEHEEKQ